MTFPCLECGTETMCQITSPPLCSVECADKYATGRFTSVVDHERKTIAAWLRAEANERDNLSDTPRHHALMLAAAAVEAGEHRKVKR